MGKRQKRVKAKEAVLIELINRRCGTVYQILDKHPG